MQNNFIWRRFEERIRERIPQDIAEAIRQLREAGKLPQHAPENRDINRILHKYGDIVDIDLLRRLREQQPQVGAVDPHRDLFAVLHKYGDIVGRQQLERIVEERGIEIEPRPIPQVEAPWEPIGRALGEFFADVWFLILFLIFVVFSSIYLGERPTFYILSLILLSILVVNADKLRRMIELLPGF